MILVDDGQFRKQYSSGGSRDGPQLSFGVEVNRQCARSQLIDCDWKFVLRMTIRAARSQSLQQTYTPISKTVFLLVWRGLAFL